MKHYRCDDEKTMLANLRQAFSAQKFGALALYTREDVLPHGTSYHAISWRNAIEGTRGDIGTVRDEDVIDVLTQLLARLQILRSMTPARQAA